MVSEYIFWKYFQIRGPVKKHLSDRQKFLHPQIFQIFWPKIVFWEHQKSKKWPHMVGNDKTSFFQELMFNTPKCSVKISGASGPITMTLLRRKVFWNHKNWKRHQKKPKTAYLPRIYDSLCRMSAKTFNAPNSFIGCWIVFLKVISIYKRAWDK